MTSLKPLGHFILVDPDIKSTEISDGALKGFKFNNKEIDRENSATTFGVIIEVGQTAWKDFEGGKPWANVGDEVIFAKYGAKEVKDPVTDKLYFLMTDESIFGLVSKEAKAEKAA